MYFHLCSCVDIALLYINNLDNIDMVSSVLSDSKDFMGGGGGGFRVHA